MQNKQLRLVICLLLFMGHPALCMKRERNDASQDRAPSRLRVIASNYGRAVQRMNERKKQIVPSLHTAQTIEAVHELLAKGVDVDCVNKEGQTALHAFVATRRIDALRALLAYGACVTVQNTQGNTPFHQAAYVPQNVAECLIVSPQGGPKMATPELGAWQEAIRLFSVALNMRGFPREIRLMVCKQILPEPGELIAWAPLRTLKNYLTLYSAHAQQEIFELLVRRHTLDVICALTTKNKYYKTPQQLAVSRIGLMGVYQPPIGMLDVQSVKAREQVIRAQYAALLGVNDKSV